MTCGTESRPFQEHGRQTCPSFGTIIATQHGLLLHVKGVQVKWCESSNGDSLRASDEEACFFLGSSRLFPNIVSDVEPGAQDMMFYCTQK
jgi:hypothetical protein